MDERRCRHDMTMVITINPLTETGVAVLASQKLTDASVCHVTQPHHSRPPSPSLHLCLATIPWTEPLPEDHPTELIFVYSLRNCIFIRSLPYL